MIMGLSQTKLHFKVLGENWHDVLKRLETDQGIAESRTQNENGDLPLHFACYGGNAPPEVIRALLIANPAGATTRNNLGRLPLDLARINYREGGRHRDEVLVILGGSWLRGLAAAPEGEGGDSVPEEDARAASLHASEVFVTSRTCVVCLDSDAVMVVVPCGHACLCEECAPKVRRKGTCPVGRCIVGAIAAIEDISTGENSDKSDRKNGERACEEERGGFLGNDLRSSKKMASVSAC